MQFSIRTTWFFMAVVSLVVSGCAVTGASGSATDTSTTNPVSPVTTAATVNSTVTTQSGQPDVPPDDVTTTTGLPADDVTTTTSDLVTIPNLQGLTSAASIHKRLNEVGLRSQIDLIRIQLHEREDPDSLVAVQEPGAGVKVRRGSTVEVLLYAPLIIDTTGDARSGTWEHFDERDGLASDCVSAIDVARDGMVWIGCTGGLSVFDGQTVSTVDSTVGVVDVVADRDGGVWVSTLNGDSGVITLRQLSDGVPFDLSLGSADTGVRPVVPDRFYGTEWTAISGGPGWGAAISNKGVVWTSGPEDGVFRYEDDWEIISRPPWMSEKDALGISAMGAEEIWTDAEGNLWAVTDGLSRFDGTVWETFLEGASVVDVTFAADGTVWAATMWTGAYSFDGEDWAHYGVDDGLISNELTSIAVEPDGSVWFGTAANGVSRFTPDH